MKENDYINEFLDNGHEDCYGFYQAADNHYEQYMTDQEYSKKVRDHRAYVTNLVALIALALVSVVVGYFLSGWIPVGR